MPTEEKQSVLVNSIREICRGSCHPSDAMSWIRETEAAQTADDLKTSQSIIGSQDSNFEMLDAKSRNGLEEDLNDHELQEKCRGIISYTSYSRTNDCIYNGYDNINLEPNAMNNMNNITHMDAHNTQY